MQEWAAPLLNSYPVQRLPVMLSSSDGRTKDSSSASSSASSPSVCVFRLCPRVMKAGASSRESSHSGDVSAQVDFADLESEAFTIKASEERVEQMQRIPQLVLP